MDELMREEKKHLNIVRMVLFVNAINGAIVSHPIHNLYLNSVLSDIMVPMMYGEYTIAPINRNVITRHNKLCCHG